MTDTNNQEDQNIQKAIETLSERMNQFSSVLEKFGMDIITKLGNLSFTINKLSDKIKELNNATLDIKSLIPQLTNIIEGQKSMEKEIHLLRSLTYQSFNKVQEVQQQSKNSSRNNNLSNNSPKKHIMKNIAAFQEKLDGINDHTVIINELDNLKEHIFELTGGGKELYEVSQIIKEINKKERVTSSLRAKIREKLSHWNKTL
jgi:chromosome segregation ATPase